MTLVYAPGKQCKMVSAVLQCAVFKGIILELGSGIKVGNKERERERDGWYSFD